MSISVVVKVILKFVADEENMRTLSLTIIKVEILKGSLDLIQSPSMKIQIVGGKVCLRSNGKTKLGVVNKLFVFKSLLTTLRHILPLNTLPANFPVHYLYFHSR